jgi:asparaginyl-tRNA synthetase
VLRSLPDLCEIVGGSIREHRKDALLKSMFDHGVIRKDPSDRAYDRPNQNQQVNGRERIDDPNIPENMRWYVDLRRYGSVPHGGFGLGFDRLLCYLSGVSSIRDMVAFPRYYGRCDC